MNAPGKSNITKKRKRKRKSGGWMREESDPWVLKCWIYVHTTHGFSVTRSPTRSHSLPLFPCLPSRPYPIISMPLSPAATIYYFLFQVLSRLQFPNFREAIIKTHLLLSMASDYHIIKGGLVSKTPLFLENSIPPGSCKWVLRKLAPTDNI